jgi:hypothetical protein
MIEAIVIERHGRAWAVKHQGGFLGYTATRDEAALIGQDLVDWMRAQGRCAKLVVDEPPAAGLPAARSPSRPPLGVQERRPTAPG